VDRAKPTCVVPPGELPVISTLVTLPTPCVTNPQASYITNALGLKRPIQDGHVLGHDLVKDCSRNVVMLSTELSQPALCVELYGFHIVNDVVTVPRRCDSSNKGRSRYRHRDAARR
jgi:hypothetical protein